MNKKIDTKMLFADLNLFSGNFDRLLSSIDDTSSNTFSTKLVMTPNSEQIVLAENSPRFEKTLHTADIAIADSTGIFLASWLLSLVGKMQPVAMRLPGVEVVSRLLHQAKEEEKQVIVIGGRSYNNKSYAGWQVRVVTTVSDIILRPTEHTLWWLPAYEDATAPTEKEESLVQAVLAKLKPTYAFVALGAPVQEEWLVSYRELLTKARVTAAMAVGGAFDMLLGVVPRAPKLLQAVGLEWLFRLILQPWRWRRQTQLVTFIMLVIREIFSPARQVR